MCSPKRTIVKVGIIACGAIVRELVAIANKRGWDYELTAVPAQLHNRPERIAPAVEKKLDAWAARFDRILIGYADCGTVGALDALIARYPHAIRIPGPHCYEFYGGALFDQQTERQPGTFYLTDFLAHHYEGLVIESLGLDRHPELRDIFFGNYEELLYLRQLPDQDESERARAAADRLGLAYREVDSGLEVLEERLVELIECEDH
ncbi:MAG: DUF1638 domain-containing protein [Caldilineaceae bacterium SB0661_bin_32]|uniref:DUF1638 domain-containing protein n=1 Tax=Caldilineaceae bacterium SB0661_bin_32 TaxID=2605255 RepID=A0A6B1D2I2_9CHLR|nr:DUF1638 domain-containing protein [Caldilineaceae bacterium SB0661_bin_32]